MEFSSAGRAQLMKSLCSTCSRNELSIDDHHEYNIAPLVCLKARNNPCVVGDCDSYIAFKRSAHVNMIDHQILDETTQFPALNAKLMSL